MIIIIIIIMVIFCVPFLSERRAHGPLQIHKYIKINIHNRRAHGQYIKINIHRTCKKSGNIVCCAEQVRFDTTLKFRHRIGGTDM